MKTKLTLLLVAALTAASLHANYFEFSYTFAPRDGLPEYRVTGDFDGTLETYGPEVFADNITNASLTINGATYTDLFVYGKPVNYWPWTAGDAMVAFNPAYSSFLFYTTSMDSPNYGAGGLGFWTVGYLGFISLRDAPGADVVFDNSAIEGFGSWTLVDPPSRPSVPETGVTMGLLAMGLATILAARRLLEAAPETKGTTP